MQLIEVKDKKSRKLFHRVPHLIYRNDPNWACPLEGMVEDTFNPKKN
ncbi:MAG: GNAT family N-acetyltransferase, partial [Bacteroidia bacterium]|nr:GNAT family N-acetyltransferase [Bacteroidia bacterium]